jgi:competence protein ComEC
VLWPERVIRGEGSVPNNASVVLLVESHGVRLLLTGDVEPAAQRALLHNLGDEPVDVLKVPHHGSSYQAPELLQRLRPRLAVISVGAGNDYGHPARVTIQALRDAGVPVARTDADGEVAVAGARDRLQLIRRSP